MSPSSTTVMGTTDNSGFILRNMNPGEKIRQAREGRGWSQALLGKHVGITQVAIKKIEAGDTQHSKFLPQIAQVLDLPLAELIPDRKKTSENETAQPFSRALSFPRDRDFPVYASAEGGPGEIIRSSDPIDWRPRPEPVAHIKEAYGLYVVGESMAPEYRPGDVALVNPKLPIIPDEVYIFYPEHNGEARAMIKHLRRITSEKWLVTQHNPPDGMAKDFTLPRSEWQLAHRVIGKYSRQ